MLKANDCRDKTIVELEAVHEDLCKELFELRNAARHSKKVEKPHLLIQKKKDIARVLTVLHEKRQAHKNKEA